MSEDGTPPRSRAVFDCGVFLQAVLRRTAPAGACLELVEAGAVELVVSEPVLSEVREVLERPELKLRRQGRLTSRMVEEILVWILEHATFVHKVPERFHYARDPDDEPYLDLAIAADAVYLVSRDKDLLDLQDPASAPGQELRRHLPQLSILDPVEFLHRFSPAPEEGR